MDKDIKKEIRGAVARGWCTKENEKKEMDTDLALAISEEVVKLFRQALEAEKTKREAMAREMIGEIGNYFYNLFIVSNPQKTGIKIKNNLIKIANSYGVEV